MEINLNDKNIISASITQHPKSKGLYRANIIMDRDGEEETIILPMVKWDKKTNIIYTVRKETSIETDKTDLESSSQPKNLPITSFTDENIFLSNFYPCMIIFEGLEFNNAEAAFQASKVQDIELRKEFVPLTASEAKWRVKDITIRKDWPAVKDKMMYNILYDKFTRNQELKQKLLDTGNADLIKENNWHDNYWGNCTCDKCKDIIGNNKMGIILTEIRKKIGGE